MLISVEISATQCIDVFVIMSKVLVLLPCVDHFKILTYSTFKSLTTSSVLSFPLVFSVKDIFLSPITYVKTF